MVTIRWSAPSPSSLEVALVAAGLLIAALAGVALPARADAAAPIPKASSAFTLYGDAGTGWGNSTQRITNPGPVLYVYQGQNVSITLYAADNVDHNWFIDFNGNKRVDAGENSSAVFSSSTTALAFNFTVPTDRVGPFAYLCRIHPTTMTGQIVILTPPVITLYGNLGKGWSFAPNKSAVSPGPTLYLLFGTNLTIHLVSTDGSSTSHTWFVDYANDTGSSGDPISGMFNATKPGVYVYTPDRTGTFEYRCSFHPTAMAGVIIVAGNVAPPSGLQLELVPAIMIATVVGVLVLAAVYQIRAVRAARRSK